jgi:hypothetical protein
MVFDELQKEHANPIVQQKYQSLFVWYVTLKINRVPLKDVDSSVLKDVTW